MVELLASYPRSQRKPMAGRLAGPSSSAMGQGDERTSNGVRVGGHSPMRPAGKALWQGGLGSAHVSPIKPRKYSPTQGTPQKRETLRGIPSNLSPYLYVHPYTEIYKSTAFSGNTHQFPKVRSRFSLFPAIKSLLFCVPN